MGLNYRQVSLSLTTLRADERIPIGAKYVVFTRVDSPITVRFDGTGQPAIGVSQPSDYTACGVKSIEAIFVTNAVGSGTIEFVITDDMRVGFSAAPAIPSEPRTFVHSIPRERNPAGIESYDLISGWAGGLNWSNMAGGLATQQTGQLDGDSLFGWEADMTGEILTGQQARRFDLYPGGAPYKIGVPLSSILSPGSRNLSGMGWWETECDVWYDFPAGTDSFFRFGIGMPYFPAVAGPDEDTMVGFAGGLPLRAGWGGLGLATKDQLASVIISDTGGGGRTIHYSKVLPGAYRGVFQKLKVRVGEVGGTPVVEWYIDGNLVDRKEGAMSAPFARSAAAIFPTASMALGRDTATSTWLVRFGYGAGWFLRQYTE